jgi:hypothetical protein
MAEKSGLVLQLVWRVKCAVTPGAGGQARRFRLSTIISSNSLAGMGRAMK